MTYFMTFHLHWTKKSTKITLNLPLYTEKLKLCYSRIHLKSKIGYTLFILPVDKKNLDTRITLNLLFYTEKLKNYYSRTHL